MNSTRIRAAIAAAMVLMLAGVPAAHEIPPHVVVHAFVKPEGQRLRVLIRVPLNAMRDMQFPQTAEGFLDGDRAEPVLRESVQQWIVPTLRLWEGPRELQSPEIVAVLASLPSDRSFVSYEAALQHVASGDRIARVPWQQALLDVLLEYSIDSDASQFSVRPGFERLGVNVTTSIRLLTPDGVRAFEMSGDPGVVVLDPLAHQAAWHFVTLGFSHVLDGVDHLLFLVCLVIPFRRLRPLIAIVTSFTLAHSITLIAAARGYAPDALWFPPLVELLIAASILYMAVENVITDAGVKRRAALAFGFGLVHGFGFSFGLTEVMQFAGSHLLLSLFSFNVGVELGQLLVLLVIVPLMTFAFRSILPVRAGTIVLSLLVGHVAWHWMADRWTALREYAGPSPEPATLLIGVRVVLLASAITAGIWFTRRFLPRRTSTSHESTI